MSAIQPIGVVSATEKNPNTGEEFTFWLSKGVKISPFDIIKVTNSISGEDTTTYATIEEIYHATDSPGHISNYISSDFGEIGTNIFTNKLGITYAKATVIDNTSKNYMPVNDGAIVYPADAEDIKRALGQDLINPKKAIPAGVLKTSNGIRVPIMFNSDFLIGPQAAHLNISGISGLATKTSYAMFSLKAIQALSEDTAIVVMNVKGDDLLRLHKPGTLSDEQKKDWECFNNDGYQLSATPFEEVKYFYPYMKDRDGKRSNTVLDNDELQKQFEDKRASNFIYSYEHDKSKLDLLLSNVDDPNWTIEAILNHIQSHYDFDTDTMNWESFKEKIKERANSREARQNSDSKEITAQSWQKFVRLMSTSINNEMFVNSKSGDEKSAQVYLSDEISKIVAGDMIVVDIANLNEQMQCLVFGDTIKTILDLKHGATNRTDIPKKIIVFVDELNKYAPDKSPKGSAILSNLLEITERGRYEGIILFSAEQFKSAVHDRVTGNCSTHIFGRTNAIEISKPDYRYIPKTNSSMMTRLDKGDLIVQHPIFKTLLKVSFPYPPYEIPNT
jgi:hypothetical protein